MQHWLGQFSFDDRFKSMHPIGLKTVRFEFTFRIRLFGLFTGEIRDCENGVPEPASVYGRVFANKSIWFTKTYPRTWVSVPETGERYLLENRKQVVRYQGIFEDPDTVSGRWEIRSQRRVVNGIECEFPQVTGTWSASKS